MGQKRSRSPNFHQPGSRTQRNETSSRSPQERGCVCLTADDLVKGSNKSCLFSLDIPVVLSENGVKVRVVLGEHRAASSPLKPLTDITLLDVTVPSGQTFTYNAKKGWNIFALTIKGSGSFSGHSTTGPMEAVGTLKSNNLQEFLFLDRVT